MSRLPISRRWRKFTRSPFWLGLCSFATTAEHVANARPFRIAVRSTAVAMLAGVTGYGILAGDHLADPSSGVRGVPAQISSWLGYAAEDIRISGLKRMDGATVLKAVGIKPGGSLVGFDANTARRLLLNLDWVKTASVRVVPPNRLEVDVTERDPFAIWQRDGNYYVIDREGAAIASFDARKFAHLMLVSGEGAQDTVSELVNQLEVWPELKSAVKGAGRVGNRRWTLYFAGGRKVLLPENGIETALAVLADMNARHKVLASGIEAIDLRLAGSAVLVPFDGVGKNGKDKIAARLQ